MGDVILAIFRKYSLSHAALLMKLHKITLHKGRKCLDSELKVNDNSQHLFFSYSVLGTGLKGLYMIAHLILTTYESNIYYCPHFTNEETEI